MMKRQSGFAAVEALLIVIIVGIVVFTGWYVWNSKRVADSTLSSVSSTNATQGNDYHEGVITIKQASEISAADKEAILTRVARPLRDWQTLIKVPATSITISKVTNMLGPNDDRYKLDIIDKVNGPSGGFLFGENKRIDYWVPQLCDDGGCMKYPDQFKAKYPGTYQAWLNTQKNEKQ